MPLGYVIALLLCASDDCQLVRVDPATVYPSYEACRQASEREGGRISQLAAQHREQGQDSEVICLRELTPIAEVDEDYIAVAPAGVYELPSATSHRVAAIDRRQHVHVTGTVGDTGWLRVDRGDSGAGFVYAENLRKAQAGEPVAARPPGEPRTPAPAPQGEAASAEAGTGKLALAAPAPAELAPAPPAAAGETRDCASCPAMIALPAGGFLMGSTGDPTERPPHRVAIARFAIGQYEVSEAEWGACVEAGGCRYKPAASLGADAPVTNLSWDDASDYVRWLAKATGKPYRLPSEAEWEYAARAGSDTPYPWGREVGTARADCKGCGGPYVADRPAAVGAFPPNAWHLYGMLGGVAEWTEDCWHATYVGAPGNGAPWRAAQCRAHVLRGGSWMNPPSDVTVSSRNFYDTSVRYLANGLRVARDLP